MTSRSKSKWTCCQAAVETHLRLRRLLSWTISKAINQLNDLSVPRQMPLLRDVDIKLGVSLKQVN